jgi:antitoxin component YwqK of YwqJK toxin-antitoxin module
MKLTVALPISHQVRTSRFIPGCLFCLFLCSLFCLSCNTKKQLPVAELRIAKTVPRIYVNTNDPAFEIHGDTIYYQHKFFTGYRYSLFGNGDTASLQSYFNGVEEGSQKKWYTGKQLAEERFFINGKKEGTHRGWWPGGKLKFIFTAINDKYSGEFKEWYASGLLGKYFHYVDGQEEGSERLWWDNGTVRANYVIRNGKKYGLIGLVTCSNPYDSVVKK